MKRIFDRCGFTLMEVNLAIFIMAVAVLGMVALYPLGFRESQHSRSDVVEAVLADGILNPIVATLSSCSTNMTWTAWTKILGEDVNDTTPCQPNNGWLAYCGNKTDLTPASLSSIKGTTASVMSAIKKINGDFSSLGDAERIVNLCNDKNIACALVVSYGEVPTFGYGSANNYHLPDRSRIVLCLRLAPRAAQLFEQPPFYAEVRFQGDPNK